MTKTPCIVLVLGLVLVLVLGLGLLACGDNIKTGEPDGSIPGGGESAFVVAGAFNAGVGVASRIDIASLEVTRNVVSGVVSSDPVLRHAGDRLYIINRFGHDNITILDARTAQLVLQLSTGPGSNPQDVAVKGDIVYVAAFASAGVLVIDLHDPTIIRAIDLSSLDPRDGKPDCSAMALAGDRLFVACGVLDSFSAVDVGKVAVIDTSTDTLLTTLDLETRNPFGYLYATPADGALGGDLLMATVDFDAGLDVGCLERIGVTGMPAARGCVVTNETLGGYASGYAYGPDDTLYIAVTSGFDEGGATARVVRYHITEGTIDPTPVSAAGQRIFELARCPSGRWVFADAAGGIRVYDAEDSERTTAPLDIGLPPVDDGLVCF